MPISKLNKERGGQQDAQNFPQDMEKVCTLPIDSAASTECCPQRSTLPLPETAPGYVSGDFSYGLLPRLAANCTYARRYYPSVQVLQAVAIASEDWVQYLTQPAALAPEVADRLRELNTILYKGLLAFDSEGDFLTWLSSEVPALRGRRPQQLVSSVSGRALLRNMLSCIQHAPQT